MSILTTIKKLLGISETDASFDSDIIIGINNAFSVLYQIGVGPSDKAYSIVDSKNLWTEFEDVVDLEPVKTYVYLKTRVFFDPPQSSSTIEAINRQIAEIEWRLQISKELIKEEEVI